LELFGKNSQEGVPLANRMAPERIEDFVGQEHIIGKGKPLQRLIEENKLLSAIFFGPPGTGKTALAKIISKRTEASFISINAAEASRGELKKKIKVAHQFREKTGRKAVFFVDEIHRFSRLQQEFFLPYVERGDFIFLASTVQNPFFAISKGLLSRALLFEFRPLEDKDIIKILKRAIKDEEKGLGRFKIEVDEGVYSQIAKLSDGDARRALNYLELLFLFCEKKGKIEKDDIEKALGRRFFLYDRDGDEHYDMISALIKSLRGSDPDASLYWCTRILQSGEDPRYVLRRLVIFASEDIGLADPNALGVATSALKGFELVGMPEGELIITQAVLYLATAPKSNTVLKSLQNAKKILEERRMPTVPQHLRDSHYKGAKKLGRGKGYISPHGREKPKGSYLPDELTGVKLFHPQSIGYEKVIKERLEEGGE